MTISSPSVVRRRVAFVALTGVVLFACNALTGIGDYAVPGDAPDAAHDGALADAREAMTSDAEVDGGGCVIVDHPPRAADGCEADAGNFGPSMASLSYPDLRTYHCIDVTEVTVADYKKFLAERGATNTCGQPPECAWNTTYAPATVNDPPGPSTPQVNVDWCDAFMYCRWAGKNLCGTMGFADQPVATVPPDEATNDGADLWYAFCRGGAYPHTSAEYFYGESPVPGTCWDAQRASGAVAAVGSASDCHGISGSVSAAIYDMAGNAAEWEWSCPIGGPEAPCLTRGGSFADTDAAAFDCQSMPSARRDTKSPTIGFRCCVE